MKICIILLPLFLLCSCSGNNSKSTEPSPVFSGDLLGTWRMIVFNNDATDNPDYIARMLLEMGNFLGEVFAEMLLSNELNDQNRMKYLEICRTYEKTIETVLRAPQNSIVIFDKDIVNGFFS